MSKISDMLLQESSVLVNTERQGMAKLSRIKLHKVDSALEDLPNRKFRHHFLNMFPGALASAVGATLPIAGVEKLALFRLPFAVACANLILIPFLTKDISNLVLFKVMGSIGAARAG